MAIPNGTTMLLLVDGVVIAGTKSCNISYSRDLPDTSTKDSEGCAENMYGQASFEGSFDGLYDPTHVYGAEEVFDALKNKTGGVVEFANIDGTGGGLMLRGNANFSNISWTAENEQPTAYSGSFKGNGALSKGTVVAS